MARDAPELELRLFGSPRVLRDGAPLTFDTRKAVALLAVLAVTEADRGRDALAGMLWPELDTVRSRAALRRTLSVASAVGPALRITPASVALDRELVRCDVHDFRALARSTDPRDGERAAALADEPFLAGFSLRDSPVFDEWLLGTADALRDELSALLARLGARAVADGDLDGALRSARQRIRVDPVSEPAHADLIRILAWSGDRPGALRAYRDLVRRLDAELGVPPLPETLALHDDIRGNRLAPPAAPPPRDAPPAPRTPVELVGRDEELTRLEEAWRSASGSGGAIGIVGDAGIGKSALLRELAERRSAEGADVLAVAGHAAERPLAFAVAGDLTRALLAARPGLAAHVGDGMAPLGAIADGALPDPARAAIRTPGDLQRLHEAFRSAIATAADEAPLLLAIDDAHLLDAASGALLAYVVRRPTPGLLVVAAWARGSGDAELPSAIGGSGSVVPVGPLGAAEVARLLGDRAVDVDDVLRRTRGIPLLVREFATTDAPDASGAAAGGASGVVAARLGAAPALTRQLVGAASVLGTVADPELLRLACGRDEVETVDAIEDAIARGLLVERVDRTGYDVPHDLLRDLALADLSLARTRLLHGRIAAVLARRHAVDPLGTPAGAVARHWSGAAQDEEAAPWFLGAARESIRLSAHLEALEQLESALAAGQPGVDVHELRGATLVRLGRYAEALVALDRAAALAEAEPGRLAAIEHAIAGVHDRLGDWDLALAHLESSLDLAARAAPERRARVLADLALVQHRLGRDADARGTALAADAAAGPDDRATAAQAANVLGVIEQRAGDVPAALARLRDAVRIARELGDPDLEIAALNNLSRLAAATGEAEAAMASAREALERAEIQGDRHRLGSLHSHMADLLHAAGREEDALAELRIAATAFSEVQGSELRGEVWTLAEW